MSITSKSPRKVLLVAFEIGRQVLPAYSHRFSPKKFTLAQRFACLVLKTFFKTDYRGVVAILHDCDSLPAAIDLKSVPHFTTLQKAAGRLLRFPNTDRLLATTVVRVMGRRKCVALAAIGSMGSGLFDLRLGCVIFGGCPDHPELTKQVGCITL